MFSAAAMPGPARQFLTEEQVAWILQVSVRTLRRWRDGHSPLIPFVNLGQVRYDPAEVQKFILANTRGCSTGRPDGAQIDDSTWERISRLIEAAVEARLKALACGQGEMPEQKAA